MFGHSSWFSYSNMNRIYKHYHLDFNFNFSLTQRLSQHLSLKLQAKNLTNPTIEEVYRSDFTGPDVTNTSYTRGIEYALSLSADFSF